MGAAVCVDFSSMNQEFPLQFACSVSGFQACGPFPEPRSEVGLFAGSRSIRSF